MVLAYSEGNHGLNGNDHADLQFDASSLLTIVRDIGILMHRVAHAMTHVLAHDAIAAPFGKLLDRMADVTQVIPGDSLLDATPQAVARDLAQASHLIGGSSHVEGPSIVTHPAAKRRSSVDGDNIPLVQEDFRRGDAMHDLLIH